MDLGDFNVLVYFHPKGKKYTTLMCDVDIMGGCAHVGLRHVRNLHTSLSKFIVSLEFTKNKMLKSTHRYSG